MTRLPNDGDVIALADGASYYHCKGDEDKPFLERRRAVLERDLYGEDTWGACFGASAFRPVVFTDSPHRTRGDERYTEDYVSCSGGPLPFIVESDLTFVTDVPQRFWHWLDRPRGGGGVEYTINVGLWAWTGEK